MDRHCSEHMWVMCQSGIIEYDSSHKRTSRQSHRPQHKKKNERQTFAVLVDLTQFSLS